MPPMNRQIKSKRRSMQSSPRSPIITIGDLTYDTQLQTLRHGERMIHLTLCESKIVAYLFRNASLPISADELLRNALGNVAKHKKTTLVETRICGIRKKIAKIGTTATIRTIRYQGYVIKDV